MERDVKEQRKLLKKLDILQAGQDVMEKPLAMAPRLCVACIVTLSVSVFWVKPVMSVTFSSLGILGVSTDSSAAQSLYVCVYPCGCV